MKVLVTGANGQLGSELRELVGRSPEDEGPTISVLFVDRDELDITDGASVEKFFAQSKPDYCINAAAYTDVEKAEDEYVAAHAVNVVGAENIAKACAKNNAILFHISTDFVFDGKKTVPYIEIDKPHPLGAYARTKYEGELAVQEHCSAAFIIRTSWLYSSFGKNFVKTILRLCAERDSLPVVADQYGSPTYARDFAAALLQMIGLCESKRHSERSEEFCLTQKDAVFLAEFTLAKAGARDDDFFGIYHYANEGEVTWFEFAQKICDFAGLLCKLKPISSSEYPSKVQRPAYSVLSTKKIQTTFGIAILEWDKSLMERIGRIIKS